VNLLQHLVDVGGVRLPAGLALLLTLGREIGRATFLGAAAGLAGVTALGAIVLWMATTG
jgi:hypothetical protein